MILGWGESYRKIEIYLKVVEGIPSSLLYSFIFLTAMTYSDFLLFALYTIP